MSLENNLLPISEYQKGFFREWLLSPHRISSNVSLTFKLVGNVNTEKLKQALEIVVKNNKSLCARFSENDEKCYKLDYKVQDFYQELIFKNSQNIKLKLREMLDKPFNLTKDNLLRIYLLKTCDEPGQYYLVFSAHHIICDGTSAMIFQKEISFIYNQLISGKKKREILVYKEPFKFDELIKAEKKYSDPDYLSACKKFWLRFVDNIPLSVRLPYKVNFNADDLNTKIGDIASDHIFFEINLKKLASLKKYVRKRKATLFLLIATAYGFILSKYANQSKILIVYPVNMRSGGYQDVIGCFIKLVLLKLEIDNFITFEDLLKNVVMQRKKVRDYQSYSLYKIFKNQDELNHIDSVNCFNVSFVQSHFGSSNLLQLKNVSTEPINLSWSSQAFTEFGLGYDDKDPGKIKFRLTYRKKLFDENLIVSFVSSLKKFINDLVTMGTAEDINLKNYSV